MFILFIILLVVDCVMVMGMSFDWFGISDIAFKVETLIFSISFTCTFLAAVSLKII